MNTLEFLSPAAGYCSAPSTSLVGSSSMGQQPSPDHPLSMQNLDDHRDTDTDSEFSDGEEEDIADQCPGQGGQAGLPSRPTSRLGFNKSASCSHTSRLDCMAGAALDRPAQLQTRIDTLDWADGLFQNVPLGEPCLAADGDMDITALASPTPELPIPTRPMSCSSSDASSTVSTDSDIDSSSDCSSCLGDSDEELDDQLLSIELPSSGFHPLLPPLLPLPIHTPKPKLACPPESSPDIFPTPHHRASSPLHPRSWLPPMPLSSFRARRMHSSTMPAHHGYSRLAFAHLKWMWAVREEAWRTRIRGGRGLRVITEMQARATSHQPPTTVDVKQLEANSDRPVWTMRKEAWMRAVRQDARFHSAHTRPPPLHTLPHSDMQDDDVDTDGECLTASTSGSTTCSDDSDATLVEGESDLADRAADFEVEDAGNCAEDNMFHDIDLGEDAEKVDTARDGPWGVVKKERKGFYLADEEEDEDEVAF